MALELFVIAFLSGSPDVGHSPVANVPAVVACCDDQVMCAVCVFFWHRQKNLVATPGSPRNS